MDDDIEAILKAAKEMPEAGSHKPPLNPLSALPSSKRKLKLAIKERIQLLCAAYISLASFIPDDEIDATKSHRRALGRVLKEMEQNRKEIEAFRPLDLPKGRRHQLDI